MGMSTQGASPVNNSLSLDFNAINFNNVFQVDPTTPDIEVLTALVRTSYLKHLQRSLTTNYSQWLEKNRDNDDFNEVCHDDIMKCANFLEHRALRACMITSFYQRAMVTTMKEIKQSTEEGSLFSPLIEQMFDNKSTVPKNMCVKETQTDVSLLSCKTIEHLQENAEKEIQDSEKSNLVITNQEKAQEKADAIEDLFNILMNSPSYTDTKHFSGIKKRKISEDNLTHYSNDSNGHSSQESSKSSPCFENQYFELSENNSRSAEPKSRNHKKTFPSDFQLHEASVVERNVLGQKKIDSIPLVENKQQLNLDERLKSFAALFGEDSPAIGERVKSISNESDIIDGGISPDISPVLHPLDWKAEYAAQICNLKMILSRKSSYERHKIRKRFRELFGCESSYQTYISVNEEALSRKRTANIVVGELTPHYIAGRIASRCVFKALAKKITDELLLLSYVAGFEEISKKVNHYFENGKLINSARDIEDIDGSNCT